MPRKKPKEPKLPFGRAFSNSMYLLRVAFVAFVLPGSFLISCVQRTISGLFGYYYSIVFLGILYSAVEQSISVGFVLGFIGATTALMLVFDALNAWYFSCSFRAKTDVDFYAEIQSGAVW